MSHPILSKCVVVGVLLATMRTTGADVPAEIPAVPHLLTLGPRQICLPPEPAVAPVCRWLPPGHFVDLPAWSMLDAETRRLQAQETVLTAENNSLRESARRMDASWQPGWKTLTLTLLAGFAGGIYVRSKI